MKPWKDMSYRELVQKVIQNRGRLRKATDQETKRRLIEENHRYMKEMNDRWNAQW